jgi:lipopolysaccharide export system permease protein
MIYETSTRTAIARSFGPTLVVLVTIAMTMILIRTLGQASIGKVNPTEVGYIMAFGVMGQLPTILSLSLYISVVATVYRMFMDSEMIIWQLNGKTVFDLAKQMFIFAWPILLIIFLMATLGWPWMNQQAEIMKTRFENRNTIARVSPGSFQESADGKRVFFVDKNLVDTKSQNVFISQTDKNKQAMTSAQFGFVGKEGGEEYLILENGQRIEIAVPDEGELKLVEFRTYGTQIPHDEVNKKSTTPRALNSADLLLNPIPSNLAELSWRLGVFLAAFNYILMGLALTSPNPRLGRGGNFVMAILFFVFYNNMINVGQNWVSSSMVNWLTYLLALHGSIFVFAMLLLYRKQQ